MGKRIAEPVPVVIVRALLAAVPVGIAVFVLVAGTAKLAAPSVDAGSASIFIGWLAIGVTAAILTRRWSQPR